MSEHHARLEWQNDKSDFEYKTYNRNHTLLFPNGRSFQGSAAAAYFGDPQQINPEDLYVAALSSCHMLTFLALAARKKLHVLRYEDNATGVLAKRDDGKLAMVKVSLQPRVTFAEDNKVSEAELRAMHDDAHAQCFIANSFTCEFEIKH